jgi:hypothetical protein
MGLAFALLLVIAEIWKRGGVDRAYWIAGATLMCIAFLGTAFTLSWRYKNASKHGPHAT